MCVSLLNTFGLSNLLLGLSYLHQNMWRVSEEDQESMPIGFEIAFPSLIEIAKSLDLDFPYDHHALQEIYYNREIKLKRYILPRPKILDVLPFLST